MTQSKVIVFVGRLQMIRFNVAPFTEATNTPSHIAPVGEIPGKFNLIIELRWVSKVYFFGWLLVDLACRDCPSMFILCTNWTLPRIVPHDRCINKKCGIKLTRKIYKPIFKMDCISCQILSSIGEELFWRVGAYLRVLCK